MIAESNFHKNKNNNDGLHSVCKDCKSKEYLFYKSLKPKLDKKICAFYDCKKEFQPTREFNIYCSVKCRDKHNKYKSDEEKERFLFKKNFIQKFENKKMREKSTKLNKKWDEKELNKLVEMKMRNYSWKTISENINRPIGACANKYKRYKVSISNTIKNIYK